MAGAAITHEFTPPTPAEAPSSHWEQGKPNSLPDSDKWFLEKVAGSGPGLLAVNSFTSGPIVRKIRHAEETPAASRRRAPVLLFCLHPAALGGHGGPV